MIDNLLNKLNQIQQLLVKINCNLTSNVLLDLTPYALLAGRVGGQTLIGGTGTTDDLILQSTSGVGATGAIIQMKVGNNGGTIAQTILNNGLIGIGTTSPENLTAGVSGGHFGGSTQNNPLWISAGSAGAGVTALVVQGVNGQAIQFVNSSKVATADFGVFAPHLYFVNRSNSGQTLFESRSSGGATVYPLVLDGNGKASFHSTSLDKALEVNLGTSDAFRLTYNDVNGGATNYTDFTVSSGGDLTITPSGGDVAITGSATVSTAGTTSTSVVTVGGTQTLSNKRWTQRVGSTTSSATPTINTDNVDIYKLTAQAVDITSFTTNLSGTPVDGDILEIQITGTAARAITWGASFVASTVALPTTTVTTVTLSVIFQYFTTSSYGNNKWVCANSF